eukprot:CAMPEP_0183300522 /NCGR_PEP_ID=MMETSP0160_2-20130417/6927_1 /TAXON_ID=2839 ORGANISM="Odontella Sinensis, Strain Grunow 1884" /NCGR_SAMPLE_ID=MMETSP0160_2 /ASSEMBLY_ACC=CAM_ASM_000250 /LENGTH=322 /DNA_ID=CAMNT_0025462961 /DNA_START=48 /DNA_END=1016 /DNA_ORIENTATION=+
MALPRERKAPKISLLRSRTIAILLLPICLLAIYKSVPIPSLPGSDDLPVAHDPRASIDEVDCVPKGVNFMKYNHWWEPCVWKSMLGGPLLIHPFPFGLKATSKKRRNDLIILEILHHLGIGSNGTNELTIIDIGLPSESLTFAREGFHVEAFEARKEGFQQIASKIVDQDLSGLINLHNVALSNQTGKMEIFDADDSSSLLESAITGGPEKAKLAKTGGRKEEVQLELLDNFVTSAVAMKIDTQGVEPEIFMGSEKLLRSRSRGPMLILMEYCNRLRPLEELVRGVHLLHGLGFTCHLLGIQDSFELMKNTKFCGDFICTRV